MDKSKIALILAAAAAYGAFRYSKMTPEQKESLKAKGREMVDKALGELNLFGNKTTTTGTSGF